MIFEDYEVWHRRLDDLSHMVPRRNMELLFRVNAKEDKLETTLRIFYKEEKTEGEKVVEYAEHHKLKMNIGKGYLELTV